MWKTRLALALSLTSITAPAFAEDGNWRVGNDQVHIVDHSIDLATAAGRERLLQRVERAARMLCRERSGGTARECEAQTIRETALRPNTWGKALTLALRERDAGLLAAR